MDMAKTVKGMNGTGKKALIAGTDFALLFTAIRDNVELPEVLPDEIPAAWLDDLSGYDLAAQLSTTPHGPVVAASTQTGAGRLELRRIDAAHLAVNIPLSATEGMDEGEIVLTVELRHKATGVLVKAQRRTIPIIKVRNIG